ncbi:MAG: hypothetical protein ACRDMA_09785 [Solirubrobacterales bacterium]
MKRAITLALSCAVAVALPAGSALAGNGNGNGNGEGHGKSLAAKECAAQKKADKAAFRALYGKHAMRNCIKGTESVTPDELANAAQQCRAEREADPEGFRETWGTNDPKGEKSQGAKRNAFGKCVSSTVKEDVEEDGEPTA